MSHFNFYSRGVHYKKLWSKETSYLGHLLFVFRRWQTKVNIRYCYRVNAGIQWDFKLAQPTKKKNKKLMYLNLVHRQIFLDWRRAKEYEKETKRNLTRNENRITWWSWKLLFYLMPSSIHYQWTFNSFASVAGVKNGVTLIKNHETIVFLSTGQMASHNKK